MSNDFEKYGGSYLLSQENCNNFIKEKGNEDIGRTDGQFIIPSNEMDELIESTDGDPRQLEEALGLKEGSLGENPVRVDINEPQKFNLRESEYDLSGSNENYLGYGETPGGQQERVIDPFPNPEMNPDVGNISNVKSPSIEQVYGSSGDSYDFLGGTSPPDDIEFANDYINDFGLYM
jgi:hypothetical protein